MDGIIIINKSKGYTSHDIVAILRKVLGIKKIGHIGTLDPNATGVLPILIGQATKISKYLIGHNKTYIATIKLGEKRDTGDSDGKIVETQNIEKLNLEEQEIEKILKTFLGKQSQTPPIYSAIKINGKKSYEYAREGKQVEIGKRDIEIYNIRLLEYMKDRIIFEVTCSKGTYIRALGEDIAERLGTIGYIDDLKRTAVDKFNIQDAVKIEDIKDNEKLCEKNLIAIEKLFDNSESIILDRKKLELFLNGVILNIEGKDALYKIYSDNKFIGLGIIKGKLLKRDVII